MRSGLSFVELVVVIAIIAILMALLFPAIQAARESARRTHCASNLRQIALALHSYEARHRSFPPGNSDSYSFLVALLPEIEMQQLFERIQAFDSAIYDLPLSVKQEAVPLYRCPSDDVSRWNDAAANYVGNMGYNVQALGFNGIFHHFNLGYPDPKFAGACFRTADIVDGLSHTAVVGEILVGEGRGRARLRTNWMTGEAFEPEERETFLEACLGQRFRVLPTGEAVGVGNRGFPWMASGAGTTLYTHCLPPNNLSCSNGSSVPWGAYTLASNHPGGVVLEFADGHIDFITNSIQRTVWQAIGTRAGREVAR
jgi:prepilin-type N-terminal cleavage/methylation domain-containing protein